MKEMRARRKRPPRRVRTRALASATEMTGLIPALEAGPEEEEAYEEMWPGNGSEGGSGKS